MKTKEQMREYKAAWATQDYHKKVKENPESFRKTRADKAWVRRRDYKERIFIKLGNKCSNPACQWLNPDGTRGCHDKRCLQIDHRFGDASNDREKFSQGTETYYRYVLNDEEGRYQLLCANCNWIKRAVNGEDNARVHRN